MTLCENQKSTFLVVSNSPRISLNILRKIFMWKISRRLVHRSLPRILSELSWNCIESRRSCAGNEPVHWHWISRSYNIVSQRTVKSRWVSQSTNRQTVIDWSKNTCSWRICKWRRSCAQQKESSRKWFFDVIHRRIPQHCKIRSNCWNLSASNWPVEHRMTYPKRLREWMMIQRRNWLFTCWPNLCS